MAWILPLGPHMANQPSENPEQSQVSEILQTWKSLGEEMFADGELIIVPKLAIVRVQAELFAIEVALAKRNGNFTHASRDLDTSRRAIRDKLKRANRYPWHPTWSLVFSAT